MDPRCPAEWPQLRSLEVTSFHAPHDGDASLAGQLAGVRLPRLERLVVYGCFGEACLEGLGACRPALPALRVVELEKCLCGLECDERGCQYGLAAQGVAELRAAWPALQVRRWKPKNWARG